MERDAITLDSVRLFAHCRSCMPQKPRSKSPSEWSRLECGITDSGLLVWCKRCNKAIAHFTPESLARMLLNARMLCPKST